MADLEKKRSTFDCIYEGSEELMKKIKRPFVVQKIKREMEAARDAALMAVDASNEKLISLRKNLDKYPLREILESRQEIMDNMAVITEIEKEYADLFGKPMPVRNYSEES